MIYRIIRTLVNRYITIFKKLIKPLKQASFSQLISLTNRSFQ